jgi:hypothetical protein
MDGDTKYLDDDMDMSIHGERHSFWEDYMSFETLKKHHGMHI